MLRKTIKLKNGTHTKGVKSRVIEKKSIVVRLSQVCEYVNYQNTSVVKSLRTCEHFDTSTYLQDHPWYDKRKEENVA